MKRLTREWLRKADGDLRVVSKIRNAKPPLRDAVCFHCQQAAEKYLKALLQELGATVPRTHDLERLLNLLLPHEAALKSLRRTLRSLTRYAVDYRYPGLSASSREARTAINQVRRVQTVIRRRLNVRRRPKKRKAP